MGCHLVQEKLQLNYEVCFKRTISFITFCVMSVFSVFWVGDEGKETVYCYKKEARMEDNP